MSYLITGGAGFIGSHVADALLARGDRVVALDDGSTGSIDNVAHLLGHPCFELHEGTVLDETLVHELAGRSDVIVHLAAAVGVKLIVEQPLRSLITNIRGTENVLEAAALAGARVMVASTSEIYGKNASGPLPDTSDRILGSPFVARWSYSEAKAVDEILAHAYWKDRGTEAIVVRFFNCVGPRQTGAYGMVVPSLVRQALAGEDLTVYGTGVQQRCFCHVFDTVAAVVSLLDHPDSPGDPFNIGALNEVSINELAEAIVARTGSSSRIVHVPYDVAYETGFEDMERRVPDIGKITSLTGWSPKHTLDDILDDVIEHQRASAG
ncbi:MAG TPA: NAD-dependent epimerase/dehydratase family protein [Actinomycetota bacterium]|nr:NAD-dependent epimerase/dehydratase family protein [Actinomycetota bacterium]